METQGPHTTRPYLLFSGFNLKKKNSHSVSFPKKTAELRGFLSVPFRVGCRTPSLFKDTELKALFRRIRATVNCFSVMKKQCAPECHFHASALGPATSTVRTSVSRLETEAMFEPHL